MFSPGKNSKVKVRRILGLPGHFQGCSPLDWGKMATTRKKH
jgi:hypothetical protein